MFAVLENQEAVNYYDYIDKYGRSYGGLTAEEYKEKGFLVLPPDEADQIISANQDRAFLSDWSEISKDQYWDALEVLPPLGFVAKYDFQLFWLREFLISNITDVYVALKTKSGPRFFKATKRFTKDYKRIIDDLKNHLKREV